jgi:hypothetical protein
MLEASEQQAQPKPPADSSVQAAPKKGISWKKIIVTIVVIAAVLSIVCVLLWWFAFRETETTTTEPVKVTTPSAKPATPSAKKDETDSWKTYTSELGYSFRYPETMTFKRLEISKGEEVTIKIGTGNQVPYIQVTKNVPRGLHCGTPDNSSDCFKTEKFTLDGVEGKKHTDTIRGGIVYVFYEPKNLVIYFENIGSNQELFNRILSTFKFLD